jgi:hypothetical protein
MLRKPIFLYDTPADPSGGGPPPPAPPQPEPPPQAEPPTPGPVPYERFKEVNDELKTLKGQLTRLQNAQKAAEDKRAAEAGEWQKLAEQREAELKTERTTRLRLQVAGKKGIPADMAERLRGETAEEMEADADSLLAFIKPATGPGVPPPGPRGGQPATLDFSKLTPEQIREKTKGKSMSEVAGKAA